MKELTVTLGKNLALFESRLAGGSRARASAVTDATVTYVSHRQLKVSGLPSAGTGTVRIRLNRGALRVSPKTRKRLRRGRSSRFRVKVTQEPVTGVATSTRAAFRAKRR